MASREFVACVVCQMLGLYLIVAYENLALNKPAWQENPYPHRQNVGADLAVDGRKANPPISEGQCTLSHGNDTAEWRVDLGGVYSIHHIVLQYMTGTSLWGKDNYFTVYFLGFSVYISNTTDKGEGTLCFKDINYTKATIPNPVNITCPYYGRYVIYYNNRTHHPYPEGYSEDAFSDLCEVEVYGCSTPGRFGSTCSTPCPLNCLMGRCHIEAGTCFGCVKGHKGITCNEGCIEGYFGNNCSECSSNCVNNTCHNETGDCYSCEIGYIGKICEKECDLGWYGKGCSTPCGSCRNQETCNHVDGRCPGGCSPGWSGYYCSEKCEDGYFGLGCSFPCNNLNCLNNTNCDAIHGECTSSCISNWDGPFCNYCAPFKFGEFCNNSCSDSCQQNRCNRTTGHCFACSGSKFGSFCEYEKEVYQQPTNAFDANVGFVVTSSILIITLTGIAIYVLKQKCFPKCRTNRDQNYELTLIPSTSGGYANIQTVELEELPELKTSELNESPLSPVSTFSADYINVSANE